MRNDRNFHFGGCGCGIHSGVRPPHAPLASEIRAQDLNDEFMAALHHRRLMRASFQTGHQLGVEINTHKSSCRLFPNDTPVALHAQADELLRLFLSFDGNEVALEDRAAARVSL